MADFQTFIDVYRKARGKGPFEETATETKSEDQTRLAMLKGVMQRQLLTQRLQAMAPLQQARLEYTQAGIPVQQARLEHIQAGVPVQEAKLREIEAGLPGKEAESRMLIGMEEGKMPGGEDGYAVGTTAKVGPFQVPLNRPLTESEQASVAGVESLEPTISEITKKIKGGALKTGSDITRTLRQGIIDSGNPLLSSRDESLQGIQADFNHIKSQLPFTAGGKALTPMEKELVFALLNITGKSDEQIIKDLNRAMSIIREKEKVAIGGSAAVRRRGATPAQAAPEAPSLEISEEAGVSDEEAYDEYLKMTGQR